MGGGDKPMRKIRSTTILEHVVWRLSDQCDGITAIEQDAARRR